MTFPGPMYLGSQQGYSFIYIYKIESDQEWISRGRGQVVIPCPNLNQFSNSESINGKPGGSQEEGPCHPWQAVRVVIALVCPQKD